MKTSKAPKRWMFVESGNIGRVRYWRGKNILDMIFKSDKPATHFYRYKNVTSEVFLDMLFADSIGSFFSTEIRAAAEKYPFTKLPLEDED